MLQPIAVPDHPDCVVAPQPHPAQHDILAPFLAIPGRVDDVKAREQRLGAGRAHIDKDEPAVFGHRIGRLPDIHCRPELFGLARHVDTLALCVVEPAVIAAAQPVLLDPAPFERGAAVRAVRFKCADPPLLVAEDDNLLAQELFLPRQVAQLIGGADRLPIAAQQLAHRAPLLDAGQLIVGWRRLPPISRFHHDLPELSRPSSLILAESAAQSYRHCRNSRDGSRRPGPYRGTEHRRTGPLVPALVIFDCDGELIDSEVIFGRVLGECLIAAEFPITMDEAMVFGLGKNRITLTAAVEARFGRLLPQGFFETMRARVDTAFERELAPISGIEELLAALPAPRC